MRANRGTVGMDQEASVGLLAHLMPFFSANDEAPIVRDTSVGSMLSRN